ncbi:MAG: ASCH domain-containing protein [Candidatus Nealsonbacteria bacterium]
MKSKIHVLRFRITDRDILNMVRKGAKKLETRVATERYGKIKPGDKLLFKCGKDKFQKEVKKVKVFRSIPEMLKKYSPSEINPKIHSEPELIKMYYGFSEYKEKIRKYGLVVLELK